MIRNYRLGEYESLDMTITDAGTSQISLRYDGLEGCAFSDLELYSDSGRTTALSASDWEYYTEDVNKTTAEAETGDGGTGKTIYKEIRILNATYQTGSIYATFNNFGTYPDGDVLGIDYIVIDADYAFTTVRNLMTYLVIEDGLTEEITITVTDSGFDERSRFKVVNKDTTYKIIVQDGTELEPYWVMPGQSVDFYDVGTTLVWASGGWELQYTNTVSQASVLGSALNKDVVVGLYRMEGYNVRYYSSSVYVSNTLDENRGDAMFLSSTTNFAFHYMGGGVGFSTLTGTLIRDIWFWHDPA